MACAMSASILDKRFSVKLGVGLRRSSAGTDWKAVTDMLCALFLLSCKSSLDHTFT